MEDAASPSLSPGLAGNFKNSVVLFIVLIFFQLCKCLYALLSLCWQMVMLLSLESSNWKDMMVLVDRFTLKETATDPWLLAHKFVAFTKDDHFMRAHPSGFLSPKQPKSGIEEETRGWGAPH